MDPINLTLSYARQISLLVEMKENHDCQFLDFAIYDKFASP